MDPARDDLTNPSWIDAQLRGAADALDPRPAAVVRAERVEESARQMLGRLETLQQELDRLLGGLRSTADSLSASLEQTRLDRESRRDGTSDAR